MSWIQHIEKQAALRAIYSNVDPTVSPIIVHQLLIEIEAHMTLYFDFSVFPTSPPPKWKSLSPSSHKIKADLHFHEVASLNIRGWPKSLEEWSCTIVPLTNEEKRVVLAPKSGISDISFHCSRVYCQNIMIYGCEDDMLPGSG